MPRGGARNRSGPTADPNSGRSETRGYTLATLPADGYTGPIPDFPLPDLTERESEVWEWAWRQPQACAWSAPTEQWRIRTVALWCRVTVACEHPEVTASMLAQLHRFADQVGFTTAGLAEMGWKIADPTTAAQPPKPTSDDDDADTKRRLRSVG